MGLLLTVMLMAGEALGAGTPAGTTITNTASATYQVSGTPGTQTATSDTVSITVSELVNVEVTLQSPVKSVLPGDSNQGLLFTVTNTGNGQETFNLAALSTLGGDNFDPSLVGIYRDSNNNGQYDSGTDQPATAITLVADGFANFLVVNNIPVTDGGGTNLQDGWLGNTQLTATSATGTGAGSVFPGKGTDNSGNIIGAAIIGSTGGTANAQGSYQVSSLSVNLSKTYTVTNAFGGSDPIPGATITFTITATVTGSGTATNVTVNDPIPANTTYVPNSLQLNGAAAGSFDGSKVSVPLGDLTSASPLQTVTFQVTIN